MKSQENKTVTPEQIEHLKSLFCRVHDERGLDAADIECYMSKINNNKLVRNLEDLTQGTASRIIEGLSFILEDVQKKAKPKVSKPVTTAQIKKIHVLLQQKGLIQQKETMVYSISDGRTKSTKELSCFEAKRLIAFLMGENAEIQMKIDNTYKAIWKLAWNMGIIYGETDDDYEMNKAKLNMFCRARGSIKKNLTEMNLPELQKIHRQFEAMYSKYKRNKKVTK